VAVARECGQASRDHRGFLDRRVAAFLEVTEQPTCGDARVLARFLAGDQHRQVERVRQVEPRQFRRGRLGDDEIASLERSAEDRSRVAL
jgi:hypothetical protein